MKVLRAKRAGEWPPGLHWTAGEVRKVPGPPSMEPPGWLEPVPPQADKPKAPRRKKADDD